MSFTFRPAVRENTPLIIGIAGPTKSGKTYSALRVATGIANGGVVAMINAEGQRGHQYADKFKYLAADITPPYTPERYTEAVKAALEVKPAVLIIDSASHMHDGPGGLLEYHDAELDRLSKGRQDRDRFNFMAWIKPKAAENAFIYTMLGATCPIVLAFRAKEKIKLVNGKPVELGWQPIAGERITFETLFTLMLPPHSKGVPDLSISEMREPFDMMIPGDKPLDEIIGKRLAEWAKGGAQERVSPRPVAAGAAGLLPDEVKAGDGPAPALSQPVMMANGEPIAIVDRAVLIGKIKGAADLAGLLPAARRKLAETHLGPGTTMDKADPAALQDLLDAIRALNPSTAA